MAPTTIYHHGTRQTVPPGDYEISVERIRGTFRYWIILRPGQTHAIIGFDPTIKRVG